MKEGGGVGEGGGEGGGRGGREGGGEDGWGRVGGVKWWVGGWVGGCVRGCIPTRRPCKCIPVPGLDARCLKTRVLQPSRRVIVYGPDHKTLHVHELIQDI